VGEGSRVKQGFQFVQRLVVKKLLTTFYSLRNMTLNMGIECTLTARVPT